MNLLLGDCLDRLKELPNDSVDSLVTDPPAGISFMGKDWDSDKGGRDAWIAWMREVMEQCARVLKPGAHGLVWALPRTSHWTATALEDSGFEVRDVVTHLFGQGFPKSLDISKAIDKAAGRLRPRVPGGQGGQNTVLGARKPGEAISGEAKQWSGWGTALKPASEHWILVRKPISEKNVAANVLKHGTGGINIDGCRVKSGSDYHDLKVTQGGSDCGVPVAPASAVPREFKPTSGRFPANLVLSHSPHCTHEDLTDRGFHSPGTLGVIKSDWHCVEDCPVRMLDEQSGVLRSNSGKPFVRNPDSSGKSRTAYGGFEGTEEKGFYGDSGGASRFFYCAKISPAERNEGLEEMPLKKRADANKMMGEAGTFKTGSGNDRTTEFRNHHPTVKPKKLMTYLTRLITPPGGVVLDPFMGSGSTGIAAVSEGFQFIGIERDPEYFEIAKRRVFHAFPEHRKQYHRGESEE